MSTNDVQSALEVHVILDGLTSTDENLSDERLAGFCRFSKGSVISRDAAPPENTLPLACNNFSQGPFNPMALIAVRR